MKKILLMLFVLCVGISYNVGAVAALNTENLANTITYKPNPTKEKIKSLFKPKERTNKQKGFSYLLAAVVCLVATTVLSGTLGLIFAIVGLIMAIMAIILFLK